MASFSPNKPMGQLKTVDPVPLGPLAPVGMPKWVAPTGCCKPTRPPWSSPAGACGGHGGAGVRTLTLQYWSVRVRRDSGHRGRLEPICAPDVPANPFRSVSPRTLPQKPSTAQSEATLLLLQVSVARAQSAQTCPDLAGGSGHATLHRARRRVPIFGF